MPGYRGDQTSLSWIPPRLASWGFVVINLGTLSPTDNPESRGDQITAAGTQLLNLGNSPGESAVRQAERCARLCVPATRLRERRRGKRCRIRAALLPSRSPSLA
jgi:hypothetical protein